MKSEQLLDEAGQTRVSRNASENGLWHVQPPKGSRKLSKRRPSVMLDGKSFHRIRVKATTEKNLEAKAKLWSKKISSRERKIM